MILLTSILLFAIFANVGLGITVFFTNRSRKTNQAYLVSATFMLLWLIANLLILHSRSTEQAIKSINMASALATCIPTSFQLLRHAIKSPSHKWPQLLRRNTLQLFFNLFAIGSCLLPSFTKAVEFADTASAPGLARPIYGPPFIFFLVYMLGSIAILSMNIYQDRKKLKGTQLQELEYLIFACLSGLVVGVFLGTIVGLITQSSNSVPIANAASVLTVSTIVAYGITVHKILTVSTLLRKTTAYALLSLYLGVIYYLSWIVFQRVCTVAGITSTFPSHFISTILVVFSMLPAQQRLEKATERLFSSASIFDVQKTMKKAGEIFQSVTTINSLLSHFSKLLVDSVGANEVIILAATDSGFTRTYPKLSGASGLFYAHDDAVVQMLATTHQPACADSLARIRQTPMIKGAVENLRNKNVTVAVGIYSKTVLSGIVLFGPRRKGRIYDGAEQDALQILCDQFAVALENARLYTEVQDSKIRNEIMLDQLVSGVIVASPEREITLFNNEAQRISGLAGTDAIGHSIDVLPEALCTALGSALEERAGARNVEAALFTDANEDGSKSIRLGTTFLFGHDEKPMGALLVFTDMTELKSLEEQVRRAGQLSSVGTLAAGMAHEIKNPLVTIKTFTQLLPKRYADPDFRKDFSTLVAHEVARIDDKVNELLRFSKPTKPHLVPMKLKDTLEQTLKLTHEQMAQRNIAPRRNFMAVRDDIQGDEKLLSQALVNLILNAIDAIGENGSITIGTSNCRYSFANGNTPGQATSKQCVRLQITDTGKGIAQDNLTKIFDPFFTLKAEGTGMGLALSHGIVQDHHGAIEVESRPGMGTTFFIFIPLLEEDDAT